MPKQEKEYDCIAIYWVSKYLGRIKAKSQEEAEEKAYGQFIDETYISLCHQCSHEIELSDLDKIKVFERT